MPKSVKKPEAKKSVKKGSTGKKFKKVMSEFEEGDLKSSSGKKVKNPKQAAAIAYSEQRRHDKTAKGMRNAGGYKKSSKK